MIPRMGSGSADRNGRSAKENVEGDRVEVAERLGGLDDLAAQDRPLPSVQEEAAETLRVDAGADLAHRLSGPDRLRNAPGPRIQAELDLGPDHRAMVCDLLTHVADQATAGEAALGQDVGHHLE